MKSLEEAQQALMDTALGYPESHEANPWGHRVAKVKAKAFLFSALHEGVFSASFKLPASGGMALALPFAEPTGYGMGKSGWVTASFRMGQDVPVELLRRWLQESFEAVAPKKLLATLQQAGGSPPPPAAKTAAGARKPAAATKAAAAKKATGVKKVSAAKKGSAAKRVPAVRSARGARRG